MRLNCVRWVSDRPLRLVLSITALALGVTSFAADKPTFQAKPADQYANKQTTEGVTIAAEAFITDDQAKTAFGKLNPWRYNILPVLVVIKNGTDHSIRVDKMRLQYELPDHSRADAIPPQDVKYSQGPGKPKLSVGPLGGVRVGRGKSPLDVPEIEIRAFSAKMIPPGETASGFVYFESDISSQAASLYATGLVDANTGKDLYYFEVPLSGK